jgi:hypothetical protein
MGNRLEVPALAGSLVRLEPLTREHAVDLAVAAEEDRASYGFTLVPRVQVIENLEMRVARAGG